MKMTLTLPVHVERTPGRCIHFGDIRNGVCAAGLSYDQVRVSHEPLTTYHVQHPMTWCTSLPCVEQANPARVTCERRELPTDDEILQAREIRLNLLDLQIRLRRTIVLTGKGDGAVTCPQCDGKVTFSNREGPRGVYARCETPGCLTFQDGA